MPRAYKRKLNSRRYASYNQDKLKEAIDKVKGGQMSLRKASAIYNISRGTLNNHVRGLHTKKFGHPTVFNDFEEKVLVKHVQTVSDWGFPFRSFDLRLVMKNYLDVTGRVVSCFKNNTPSPEWANAFLKRHKDSLRLRSCQNLKRVRAEISSATINEYFNNLETSLKDEDGNILDASRIFNYDETNLTDDPGVVKCLFRRGTKYPERVKDSTKASISLMFCGSAAGDVLPPYVVYKSDHLWNRWMQGGLKGVRYNRSKSGWFDAVTFSDWFESSFLPYTQRLAAGKFVIIGDNLASHFTERVITLALENNIAFVCLPKNSTHLCQPLDVAFYRPLKMKWRSILDDWKNCTSKTKRCTMITKDAFPSLLKKLCLSVCEQTENKLYSKNLVSGFRKCGIMPLNRNEVLSRLPETSLSEETNRSCTTENISNSVIKVLKSMRSGKEEAPVRRKRSRINVQPGKSVSFEDISTSTEMTRAKRRQKCRRVVKQEKSSLDDINEAESVHEQTNSEEEFEQVDEIDDEDIEQKDCDQLKMMTRPNKMKTKKMHLYLQQEAKLAAHMTQKDKLTK